uniref:Uncharacterized protein n=1 Tax=Anopheles farauti TaxID=69004 RepID=A0A182Q0L8_9DIPT
MGAHGSKEKLSRSASERYVHTQVIERERFGSFGKRGRGEGMFNPPRQQSVPSDGWIGTHRTGMRNPSVPRMPQGTTYDNDAAGSCEGPAKKRDVRTINSSSSDLGPPSKTNGTQQVPARSSAARAAAALQKRISPTVTNASIPLVPEQLKASPPSKRNMLLKRNGTANGTLKTPLKVVHITFER